MRARFLQLLVAELLAFGALVFGGLAMLGAAMTWTDGSRHPAALSWSLVAAFALIAIAFGRAAALRVARVLSSAREPRRELPATEA